MHLKLKTVDSSLTVRINGNAYTAEHIPTDSFEVIKAWRLRKEGGDSYVVADTINGPMCECADFIFRHLEKGTECKHIRALRDRSLLESADVYAVR